MELIKVSCFDAPLEYAPGHLGDVIYLQSNNLSLSALLSPHLQFTSALPLPVFAVIRYFTELLQHRLYSRQASCDTAAVFNQGRVGLVILCIQPNSYFIHVVGHWRRNRCCIMKQWHLMLFLKPWPRDINSITDTCKLFSV